MHVVILYMLLVVFGHQSVVQSKYSIGVSLSYHLSDEIGVVMIEMHIANHQEVTLKLMVLLTFEKRRSNEQQLQFFQLI